VRATDLALRTPYTEDWRVGFVILISVPLAVAAWLKIGPIAGTVAVAWLLLMLYISSRPGATLFGPGPYSSASRPRTDKEPTETPAGPTKNRRV
jgi:hypothetical protein